MTIENETDEIVIKMRDAEPPLERKRDTCPDCGSRGVIAYQGEGKYECSRREGSGQV